MTVPRSLRLVAFSVLQLALLSGCSSLKVRHDDAIFTAAGKVAVRVPLALFSFGRSEQWFSIDRTMESWVGKRAESLVFVWGRPSDSIPDGTGGGMLIYTQEHSVLHPGESTSTTTASASGWVFPGYYSASGQAQTTTTYTPAWLERYTVYRSFRVNSDGIITAYSWRGM